MPSHNSIKVRTESASSTSRIEKHKRELGRAFASLTGVRLYHNKTEILIRWKNKEIRYFPEDSFRVQYGKHTYQNVSISDLALLVKTGKMRGIDVA